MHISALKTLRMVVASIPLVFLVGCASTTMGTKIDSGQVNKIEKGVTTRAQMETMFGPPATVVPYGDGSGRQRAMWQYYENNAHADASAYVPVVNMFASSGSGTGLTQTLNVTLNQDNIVENFDFSENKTASNVQTGIFGTHTYAHSVATPESGQSQ